MTSEEALRVVFPLLCGRDLASCMLVCKQWRDIAGDDCFWKCLCAKRWPSICKRSTPHLVSYRELFQKFFKSNLRKVNFVPSFSFDDLEFYIDIWNEERLVLSKVIPGSALPGRITDLSAEVYKMYGYLLHSHPYEMIIPLEPKLRILSEMVSLSVLVCRKDTNKLACIYEHFDFNCLVLESYGSHQLDFAPPIPRNLLKTIDSLVTLLVIKVEDLIKAEDEDEDEDDHLVVDVFGIALEFGTAVKDKDDFLSVLHMLDWD